MKRAVFVVVLFYFFALWPLQTYCQTDNNALKNVIPKLKAFSANHIAEKAYLHFDKPYYAAGDTIYFKAYVTLGEKHQPSTLSGVLHVDLVNTANKIDQSIKLHLADGVAWGDFVLPDSLPKGNYRVRAYTQWMRNEGSDAYFDQIIPVGSNLNNKTPENSTAHKTQLNIKPDVQFFPEGGELVIGIPSKIAFKAIDTYGLGVRVKGVIVDNSGNEVTNFNTAHLGMGYFYLTPQQGKSYKAKITYSNGVQDITGLPQAISKGIVLNINNESPDKAPLQIIANESYFAENHDKTVDLLVYSGGVATMVPIRLDSAVIHLAIIKRHIHSGITRVTLFSEAGEPLSERLIFVQNPDHLNLSVNTDDPTIVKRGKVHFNIHASNRTDSAIAGHFSVAVIDESKVPVDENAENTIFNYLLLTSELKGHIEQPNYYFTNVSEKTRADLDLVMLTHGYRRFEWKQLLNNEYPAVAFQPESSLEVAGTAKNLFGKPLANAKVALISMQGGGFASAVTNKQGVFRFANLIFPDTAKFVLQAVNAKGKSNTKLIYDKDTPEPVVLSSLPAYSDSLSLLMQPLMENNRKQQEDNAQYGTIHGRMLKNVTIRDRKIDALPTPVHNFVSHQFADQLILADQMAKGGPLSVRIEGALHGVSIVRVLGGAYAYGGGERMRVILDGMDTDDNLDEINGDDVESIDVLRFPATFALYRKPTLVINTKRNKGLQSEDIVSVGILPITPKGFYKAREFYSPRYTASTPSANRPDLRTTIFWNPELTTDKDGNANFEYYNADDPGTYRMVIEGIDDRGNLGRQVYRYQVK